MLIRKSKTDQEGQGQGQEVAIPRGYRLRPVEAVQAWLTAAKISAGPVFRAVALGSRVSGVALADDSAARIVKRYAVAVGLDPAIYSGHSLRAGFLTSAAEAGASVFTVAPTSLMAAEAVAQRVTYVAGNGEQRPLIKLLGCRLQAQAEAKRVTLRAETIDQLRAATGPCDASSQ